MAGLIAKKTRIRVGHRGMVTKRIKEVEDTIAAATGPSHAPIDLAMLTRLKLSLREKLDTVSKLDDEIFELIENEVDLVSKIDTADAYKQNIYDTLVKVDEQINATTDSSAASPCTPSSTPAATAGHATRLPKLQLPTFNGDITKWTSFWDAYVASIHKNVTLSDIEKFTYLRSVVTATARDAIAGLVLSSANYGEAIAILEKCFGNKQQIIAKHMDT